MALKRQKIKARKGGKYIIFFETLDTTWRSLIVVYSYSFQIQESNSTLKYKKEQNKLLIILLKLLLLFKRQWEKLTLTGLK